MSITLSSGRWTRRRFALAVPLCAALSAVGAPLAGAASAVPQRRVSRTLMGTTVDLVAEGTDAAALDQAMAAAFAEMERLEALLSRYRSDSVVRRIGGAAGRFPVKVPAEVLAVLRTTQRLHAESGGAFDATIGALDGWHFEPGHEAAPSDAAIAQALGLVQGRDLRVDMARSTAYLARPGMALDLGGVAKLPILDAGLRVLEQRGVANAMVNGGGDVLVRGRSQGRPWRVGIRNPYLPDRLSGVLELSGRAVVASSGDYERCFMQGSKRLHHVLDPHTGRPTEGVHGAVLTATEVAAVNGWGTALMVQGASLGRHLHGRQPGVELWVAGATPAASWMSPGLQAALRPAV